MAPTTVVPSSTRKETESEILLLPLEGDWTAKDFIYLFDALRNLHGINDLQESWSAATGSDLAPGIIVDEESDLRQVRRAIRALTRMYPVEFASLEDEISVRSVSYASPGNIQLVGVDGIIRQLRKLIRDFLFVNRARRQRTEHEERLRKIEYEKALFQHEVEKLRLARDYVRALKELDEEVLSQRGPKIRDPSVEYFDLPTVVVVRSLDRINALSRQGKLPINPDVLADGYYYPDY